ncbi:MAG: AAA family ATPase [Phycisphaerae bacterium]
MLVPLTKVVARPAEWLWPKRIQLGALNIVAGDPGLGKSFVTLDIAARVSAGTRWPDQPNEPNKEGDVIILAAEDNLDDAVKPRLTAAGANPARIVALTAVRSRGDERDTPFCLEDHIALLEQEVRKRKGVRLIIIDPVDGFLGHTDTNQNEDVRVALGPLKQLAEQHHVAVLLVKHLNKNVAQPKAVYRVGGSIAFTAFARATWLISRDRENPRRRLMTCAKLNNAEVPPGLGFVIRDDGDGPAVSWDQEPVELAADEALASEQGSSVGKGATERAKEWLKEQLANGPVEVEALRDRAVNAEIAQGTLVRAAKRVGVVKNRPKGIKNPPWTWELPSPASRATGGTGAEGVAPASIDDTHDKDDEDEQHVKQRPDRVDRVDRVPPPMGRGDQQVRP